MGQIKKEIKMRFSHGSASFCSQAAKEKQERMKIELTRKRGKEAREGLQVPVAIKKK